MKALCPAAQNRFVAVEVAPVPMRSKVRRHAQVREAPGVCVIQNLYVGERDSRSELTIELRSSLFHRIERDLRRSVAPAVDVNIDLFIMELDYEVAQALHPDEKRTFGGDATRYVSTTLLAYNHAPNPSVRL